MNGQPSRHNAEAVKFTFDDKDHYTYDFSELKEAGTYKIDHNRLYTQAKGQKEIMVKIAKLTKDSLVFDMGRSGLGETLFLIRE